MQWDVVIIGSGNAGLAAGIAACEAGKKTLIIEKADQGLAGGNTKYTAGAMRFAYDTSDDLLPLLTSPDDPRVAISDFGSYPTQKFADDLQGFNDGEPLTPEQTYLVGESYNAVKWLAEHGVTYEPIYARQSFEKDGKLIFWGGLTLAAENEGVGLFDMELAAFRRLGGAIRYGFGMQSLLTMDGRVTGVALENGEAIMASSVILACGGFEANEEMRAEVMGPEWAHARTRGTPLNRGDGLRAAWQIGAQRYGRMTGCHATPMDLYMKPYGNLSLPHGERKNYRKISYFLGVMLNAEGARFVDEGADFRNYTYAQFGGEVLRQPGHKAWQFFDAKTADLLYGEYSFHDASYIEADTLDALVLQCEGLDSEAALKTLEAYNAAVDEGMRFDPTVKDGKSTRGLNLPKSNWAQKLDTAPFRAYPVTGGITFTYGGLKISEQAEVMDQQNAAIPGLYACGELVGGVFLGGYPGGSGLTSGAVFGRLAGASA